ncbi:hypothetical protein H5410_061709 [Solanum commersonii]|uniref:Uncharacterized protein n=1 Tax=Solanum commersonii TaxID=4109 RepID=A0A9J5W9E7_SOLCO|nr:hypothetical protein H5410_061709 [Solanum commersonii]
MFTCIALVKKIPIAEKDDYVQFLVLEDAVTSLNDPSFASRGFRWQLWNLAQTILGVGPTFHRSNLQMEIPPSPLSPKYRFQLDSIYGLYFSIPNESETSKFNGEALGDRSEGKDPCTVSWSTAWLSGRLWLSLDVVGKRTFPALDGRLLVDRYSGLESDSR